MKVTIAGTGYVGLSNAMLLAQNHQVVAVDIIEEKIALLNNNKSPILDNDINNFLENKKLNFKIYNVLGNLIKKSVLYQSKTKLTFDLAKGTYIITIDSNGKVIKSKKIVAL